MMKKKNLVLGDSDDSDNFSDCSEGVCGRCDKKLNDVEWREWVYNVHYDRQFECESEMAFFGDFCLACFGAELNDLFENFDKDPGWQTKNACYEDRFE